MFNLLVDTCVWLDLAKDVEQHTLLPIIEELAVLGDMRLIVPQTVISEFERNKKKIIQDSGRSMSGTLKRVKEAVEKFGDPAKRRATLDELNNIDHRIPLLGEAVNGVVARIEQLFREALVVEISDDIKLRAAQRAIDKLAPFHRQRNSIGDAILIEVYTEQVRNPSARGERFAFVTHNVNDFSDPKGNKKTPHPDLAPLFSKIKSLYFVSLAEAVHRVRPDLVPDLLLEHGELGEEPWSLAEIVAAINELWDKIWYNRHKYREAQIAAGEVEIVEKINFPVEDIHRWPVQRDVWKQAKEAAKKKEKQYGLENLGPWTDFEWGMLSGKLSALRWVLGDEWDMLDT